MNVSIETVIPYLYTAIILLFSIGLHEYAHARSSYKLGDPTPMLQGRVTMNPFKHLSILWFLAIFFIGFGRGKPVQINPSYYKHPFRDELISSMAGPLMNFFLAFLSALLLFWYNRLIGTSLQELMTGQFDLVTIFLYYATIINISLAVFNLLPIYPLDGYRLIGVFSKDAYNRMRNHANMIMIIFLILLMVPGNNLISDIVLTVSEKIYHVFFVLFSFIFY